MKTRKALAASISISATLKWARVLFVLALLSGCNRQLKPFTSDGCSAFPDGTLAENELWLSCCEQHDLAYWKGGSYSAKIQADEALETCVAKIGNPEVAKLMLAGVAVGGSAYLPTTFRWGYGWPYPRLYKALSVEEEKQIEQMLGLQSKNPFM